MLLIRLFLTALILIVSTPFVSLAEIVDMIAARVNDEVILLSEFKMRIKQVSEIMKANNQEQEQAEDMEDKILEGIIEEKLLLQYAKDQEYEVTDEEVEKTLKSIRRENNLTAKQMEEIMQRDGILIDEYKNMLKEQRMISNVMNMEVNSKVNIDDKDLRKYYEKHKEEFMTLEEIRVRHILILVEKNSLEEKRILARKKAEDILNRIKQGEDFEKLARLYSEDGSGVSGGDLGFFKRGKMIKAFENVAFNLEPGDLSGIVETVFGFHIIKCEEKRPIVPKDIKDVLPEIENKLFIERVDERKKAFIKKLKGGSIIERRI